MKRDTNKKARSHSLHTGTMNDIRLAIARKRLANCHGQAEAIEAVREIVSNFLGSEEMALFDLRSADAKTLWSFGSNAAKYNLLDGFSEKGLGNVVRGECQLEHVGGEHGHPARKGRAFVPIRVGNETVGVLAILQLLPQKAGFDAADMEILKFISHEAGRVLFDAASPPSD